MGPGFPKTLPHGRATATPKLTPTPPGDLNRNSAVKSRKTSIGFPGKGPAPAVAVVALAEPRGVLATVVGVRAAVS